MADKKICPIMSRPDTEHRDDGLVECVERRCMFWTTVFTTQHRTTSGCVKVLQAEMVEGRLRV